VAEVVIYDTAGDIAADGLSADSCLDFMSNMPWVKFWPSRVFHCCSSDDRSDFQLYVEARSQSQMIVW